jgi:sortase (surface protein transpeptidase)
VARRNVATANAVLVVVAITGALVVLITGSSFAAPDSVEFVAAAAITSAVPPTVAPPPVSTTTNTSPQPVPSTSTVPAITSTTAAPIAPIATYPADIGVLAPSNTVAPLRVIIPELEIDGPVLAAGVNAENQLDVPPDARTMVWYRHGPTPGAPGSAVIAGHLNWRGVDGLFARLAETPIGATIFVVYDDGSEQAFTVSTVELVPKPAVSVNGVFARDGDPVLRLVTCGGEFEEAVRSYRSNVIVTAVPA